MPSKLQLYVSYAVKVSQIELYSAHLRVVEWDFFGGVYHMNKWLFQSMPNGKLIENVWIPLREVSKQYIAIHDFLNDLISNYTRL
ncbi:hypothetical protein WG75_04930 [Citromicrobium sp. WPS32]|nr:hypothetical protein WG75_04930 [Citromicrobium sp. WPS32]